MLRNRIVNGQKASDATYVAHADLVRGMAVVKGTAGKTAFVSATTDENVFLVDRDNIPSGVECAYTDRPDKEFDAIKSGEALILRAYVAGESFYTNQYGDGVTADGTAVGVDKNGKWVAHSTGKKYVSRGVVSVAGEQMLAVEVIA